MAYFSSLMIVLCEAEAEKLLGNLHSEVCSRCDGQIKLMKKDGPSGGTITIIDSLNLVKQQLDKSSLDTLLTY